MCTIATLNGQALNESLFGTFTDFDNFGKIAAPITERILPLVKCFRSGHMTKRPVIAITGVSGVGKSHFADQLFLYLQEQCIQAKILHLDDFLNDDPFEGVMEEIHPHFDYLAAHAFLKKIENGELLIEKPAWGKSGPIPMKARGREIYDLRDVELLIFEGEFALCDEKTYDFIQFSNVRIALDAKDKDIIAWDWNRARYLETDVFDEFSKLREISLSKYRKFLEPLFLQYSDFLITKDSCHNYKFNNL